MQKKMQRKIVLISHCFPRSRSNLASPFFPPPSLRSIVQKRLAVWSISMVKSNPNYRSDPEVTITFGRYGQVKNHGMSEEMINSIMNTARDFFNLPESERLKSYSDDPTKTTRLSTSFNVKAEKVTNWRDFLRLHCYPLEDYIHEWHSNPPQFSEGVRNGINSNPFMISENLQSRDMILKKNGD
ncbi:probable 2-oxoglutarate-dependent dioxygenase SLC1 isoform X2 [Euphorbia lathyris]|uniref:probable 2-oxoglutarate-dependent dioxygenase SLC1 isoform X2 n=1 Tax=Euphorbia lathyris TaxID=212925 RepID=UPI003313B46C